jgi:hypothetical protein
MVYYLFFLHYTIGYSLRQLYPTAHYCYLTKRSGQTSHPLRLSLVQLIEKLWALANPYARSGRFGYESTHLTVTDHNLMFTLTNCCKGHSRYYYNSVNSTSRSYRCYYRYVIDYSFCLTFFLQFQTRPVER